MPHNKNYSHNSRTVILVLFGLFSITIVASAEPLLSIISQSSEKSSSSSSAKEGGTSLTFLLKPANKSTANADNNADTQERGQLYLYHKDNERDNNDVLRFRREDVNIPTPLVEGSSKVVSTNWGTYEEQAPIVVQSESRTAIDDEEDESPTFSDEYQSREHDDSSDYGGQQPGSISYEDYESGRFEGRQFNPSRGAAGGGGYDGAEQEDGYYRQKYYATTARPEQRQPVSDDEDSEEDPGNRPRYPYRNGSQRPQRPQYRQPVRQEEPEEASGNGLMSFIQKAKTFYDIFRAMNSAWKTVEDHYRKTGQGIFPEDLKKMNESQRLALTRENQLPSNKRTNPPATTKQQPPNADEQEQQDTTQDNDENRSRRSSIDENANAEDTVRSSTEAVLQSSESDLESSESELSNPSTAVAEGRYIKGDPLKGYYDFVITEGSYKFWAVFQVGTAILIIYSTFAAIYYSKVNPLVSDYDYIDYLGGGRSLSDDSDFVDTDAPAGVVAESVATADGSEIKIPSAGASAPGGASRSRQQYGGQSSAGWFDWMPHAGHTLRFILESIDKVYNEE